MNKLELYAEILRQLRTIPDTAETEESEDEMESEDEGEEEPETEDDEETPTVRGAIKKAMKNGD